MSAVPRGRSSCWTSGRSGDIKRTTNVSTVSNLGGLIRRFFSHGHQCGAGVHRTQGSRRRPPRRQHRRRVAGEPGCAARVADLQPRRDAGAARRPEFPTTPPARRFCFSTTPLTARLPRRRAASLPAHSCNRDSSQGAAAASRAANPAPIGTLQHHATLPGFASMPTGEPWLTAATPMETATAAVS